MHDQTCDPLEMAEVAGHQRQLMLQGCGCDQCVGDVQTGCATDTPGPPGDLNRDLELREASQQGCDGGLLPLVPRKQLRPSDDGGHRTLYLSGVASAYVVYQDIGIEQDAAHSSASRSITLNPIPIQIEAVPLLT